MQIESNRASPRLAVILVLLLTISLISFDSTSASSGRVAGMDVSPVSATVSYTSTADHSEYAALSSQNPSSIGMNRPADLWIIDGMYMVSQTIEVGVENFGDTPTTSFSMQLDILHDEYADFILYSHTFSVPIIAPGTQATVSTSWIPDYTGNHTIRVETMLANDANTGNNVGTRSLTIGNLYDRAEATGSWTLGSNWYLSSEASLSGSNSFHVGGTSSSSNYGNNWDTSLISATIDTSDAHPNPTRGIGLGFFYTGSSWSGNPPADSGDGMDIDVWNGNSWQRISPSTVSADVDTDFISDGSSWLISVNQVGNNVVPYWGMPASAMNSQFKFRINFHSNAAGTNIGHWIEDIVMFYDQKARPDEFSLSASSGQSGHAKAGEWAETTISLSNNGNLTDEVALDVQNLPTGWNHRFQHMTGSMIPDGVRIELAPGESRNVKLLVQPSEGSALGSSNVQVTLQSLEASVTASTTASFVVDPDYEPSWVEQDPGFYCLPGNACDFEITLENIGDGQDTFTLTSSEILTHDGWTFGLKWDQATTITIGAGETESIWITANLPGGALPGLRASSEFLATSQANPNSVATIRANVTAAMVSSGHVGVDPSNIPAEGWWISPNEKITIPFTIWNNATQQDSYGFSFDTSGVFGWTVAIEGSSSVVIAPGSTATVFVSFIAPESVLANDPAPMVTPHAISTESGMSATESVFSSIRVRQSFDLTLTMDQPPSEITPGSPIALPFQIENLGNGADNVVFSLNTPNSWTWWVDVDGAVLSGPLSLSTIYDGNHQVSANLWIDIPGSVEADEIFDLTFRSISFDDSSETPEEDSSYWSFQTRRIAVPEIDSFVVESQSAWVGQSISHALILRNSGNTYDTSLRARATVDSIHPGMFVQLHSSRGIGQLNGWVDIPLAPGGEEELLLTFETDTAFTLGTTVVVSVEIEGGKVFSTDVTVTTSTSIEISVNQRRDLQVNWDLDPTVKFKPDQNSQFQINVTSDSTMPISVYLTHTIPDTVTIDCSPQAQNGSVTLVLPVSYPGPSYTGVIVCDIALQKDDLARTLSFELVDDRGTIIWTSGMTHLKTADDEQAKAGALSSIFSMEVLGIVLAILFITFVIAMVSMILRRASSLENHDDDEYEYQDDEGERPDVQTEQPAAAGPPGPMPGAPGPMPVSTPVIQEPVAYVQPEVVVEDQSPENFTDEQLRASGWNEEQIAELRGATAPTLTGAFDQLGSVSSSASAQEGEATSTLPTFTCIVTGQVLTADDAWWQCKGCNGFAAAVAIANHSQCPSCNTPV